ncbi:MAG: hypothetical protein O2973_10370 [Gemmatimonadetes bacterium]|nr:hypothetical protein [Gemmatimonadota bacterium]
MRRLGYALALVVAIPTLASAQGTAWPITPVMKDALNTMVANVAKIEYAPERERWQANVDLWRVRFDNQGKLSPAAMKAMEPAFATMERNVGRLIEPKEKERWATNGNMWIIVRSSAESEMEPDPGMLKALFTIMQANVKRIDQPEEMERWTANVALWKAMLEP